MKNVALVCAVSILGLGLSSLCQARSYRSSQTRYSHRSSSEASTDYTGDVFCNPLGFALGGANIGYQGALPGNQAWKVMLDYYGIGVSDVSVSAFGVGGAWDFFFDKKTKLQGWFAGPLVNIWDFSATYKWQTWNANYTALVDNNQTVTSVFFGVGGEVGYQWILGEHFVLTPALSLQYFAGTLNAPAGAPSFSFGGILPGAQLNIGYAF